MYDDGDGEYPQVSAMQNFLASVGEPLCGERQLTEVLYTLGECGMLPDDVDSVSNEQAILLWKAVEAIRLAVNIPDNIIM